VQIGLEERENLTVTGNVSIAIRSLSVTLLATILALALVVISAEDADARKVRRKKGVADFAQVFHHCEDRYTLQLVREQCEGEDTDSQRFEPPDRFSCRPGRPFLIPTRADWDPPNIQPPKPIDGYICRAEGSVKMVSIGAGPPVTQAAKFDLNDVLDRDAPRWAGLTPPPGPLASPDLFKCHLVPNAPTRTTDNFSCEFAENQQTCVITMHELVPTNVDEVDDDDDNSKKTLGGLDRWDPEDKVDSFNDLFLPIACHPVPLAAVPAGADAAGEGSAAWLFGLVLAAGGAVVGGVVIARRRFLHAS